MATVFDIHSFIGLKHILLVHGYTKQYAKLYVYKDILYTISIYLHAVISIKRTDLLSIITHMFEFPDRLINIFYNYQTNTYNLLQCQKFIDIISNSIPSETSYSSWQLLKTLLKSISHHQQINSTDLNKGGNLNQTHNFNKLILDHYNKYTENTAVDEKTDDTFNGYDEYKKQNNITKKAIQISQYNKLHTAIKYLLNHYPTENTNKIKKVASFLFFQPDLDINQVGEFISASGSRIFSAQQHKQLLIEYMQLLDFTGESFDSSFRKFITSSGFRLPKYAQNIDRLMDAFAMSYTRDNSDIFTHSDHALILAYGVLMLNTELYSPKARCGMGGGPMSKADFIRLVQSGDDGTQIDENIAGELFTSVRERPIEMGYVSDSDEKIRSDYQIIGQCKILIQKRHSMRTNLVKCFQKKEITKIIFTVIFNEILSAIIRCNKRDIITQCLCLDVIKHLFAIGLFLNWNEIQLHNILCELAKIVFKQYNKHLWKINIDSYSTQEWFVNVTTNFAQISKKDLCKIIAIICNDTKEIMKYDDTQEILSNIQKMFGGSVYVLHPDRVYIDKIEFQIDSSNSKRCVYLFNDLLIYTSEENGKLIIINVFHLCFCEIFDMEYDNKKCFQFKIVSCKNKELIVFAKTKEDKNKWFELIESTIKTEIIESESWVNKRFQKELTNGKLNKSICLSKYVGKVGVSKKHVVDRIEKCKHLKSKLLHKNAKYEMEQLNIIYCKICLKMFKTFTRKFRCPLCFDNVCKNCFNKEKRSTLRKICDLCKG
eukprot:491705_1